MWFHRGASLDARANLKASPRVTLLNTSSVGSLTV
jgi:hypothetical protein